MNWTGLARVALIAAVGAVLATVAFVATAAQLKPEPPPVVAPIEVAESRAVPDRVRPRGGSSTPPARPRPVAPNTFEPPPAGPSVSPAPAPAPAPPPAPRGAPAAPADDDDGDDDDGEDDAGGDD